MIKAKVLLVAEVDLPDDVKLSDEAALAEVESKLSVFYQSTQASREYGSGITLYTATQDDMKDFVRQQALLPKPGIIFEH